MLDIVSLPRLGVSQGKPLLPALIHIHHGPADAVHCCFMYLFNYSLIHNKQVKTGPSLTLFIPIHMFLVGLITNKHDTL